MQQSPSPPHHGWRALPVSILAGTLVIPGGIAVPSCVGVLALILGIQTTAWVFSWGFSLTRELLASTGQWAVMGFGDSHSHSCSKERLHPTSVPEAGEHECSGNTKIFQVEKYAS